MTRILRVRLAAIMFLQYAVPGVTLPILSYYLKGPLGFEPFQTGVIMAMPAVAAWFAPLAASRIADRYISAERMLALCHFCCAGAMLLLHEMRGFPAVLCAYLLYGVCFTPTFGLSNTVALHHVTDPQRDFAPVRMWGTVGWCVIAWVFGYFWLGGGDAPGERLHHALLFSALMSSILGLYGLTFRSKVHQAGGAGAPSYGEILRVFRRPSILLLCVTTFLNSMCHQFYYYGMGPYLNHMGVPDAHIMPAMSIGQMTEVVLLGILGWCLLRLGMKRAMIIAVLAQAGRFIIFSVQGSFALILFGISLHGICYAFYFTTAYLYVDQHSTPQTRAGVQQMLTVMIAGPGTLFGFLLAGATAQWAENTQGAINYTAFWLVPVTLSAAIALAMALAFREER